MSFQTINLNQMFKLDFLGNISGFPRGWTCTTILLSDSLFNILSAQVTTSLITSITEDTQAWNLTALGNRIINIDHVELFIPGQGVINFAL